MWPKIFDRKPDPLLAAILENNALLRADLHSRGVSVPLSAVQGTPPPSPSTPRQRTERDVTVMTRGKIWERQQQEKDEATRPWNQSFPSTSDARDSKKPLEKPD